MQQAVSSSGRRFRLCVEPDVPKIGITDDGIMYITYGKFTLAGVGQDSNEPQPQPQPKNEFSTTKALICALGGACIGIWACVLIDVLSNN